MAAQQPELVVIEYSRLLQPFDAELDALLEKAYGFEGLGVLAIRGVPNYAEQRAALLPLGFHFGNLPDEVKAKYVHEESLYSFGWSHGKEKLEGKPDLAKGSYYANPLYNKPTDDEELMKKYIASLHPNIWPTKDDFAFDLEGAFMGLGKTMCDTGLLLTKLCDQYVKQRNPDFEEDRLTKVISESKCGKARLLYYFPFDEANPPPDALSSWCGTHLDSGSLTALTSAMFFTPEGQQIQCPDPDAGLYITARNGTTHQVKIPADCIAYQAGECLQIHSGGHILATPHAVKAAKAPHVSRSTFACFMQPNVDYPMTTPAGTNLETVRKGANAEFMPAGVPALLKRWDIDGSQTYGEFSNKTFEMYY